MSNDDLQTMAIFIAVFAPIFSAGFIIGAAFMYGVYRLIKDELEYRRLMKDDQ